MSRLSPPRGPSFWNPDSVLGQYKPVLWYPCMGDVNDRSSAGNHGILTGGAFMGRSPGFGVRALQLDGTNDTLDLPSNDLTEFSGDFTVLCKVEVLSSYSLSNFSGIVCSRGNSSNEKMWMLNTANGANTLQFSLNGASGWVQPTDSGRPDGKESLAGRLSGTTATLWREGAQVASLTGAAPAYTGTRDAPANFGCYPNNGHPSETYFPGNIFDVIMFDEALPDGVMQAYGDQSTQWDHYWQPGRVTYFIPEAVVGGLSIPVVYHHYANIRNG